MSVLRGLVLTWPGRGLLAMLVAAVVGGPMLIARANTPAEKADLRTATVARGAVTQTVAVSGSLSAAAQIRLNFKSAGKIAELYVRVGDQVTPGQKLARLDLSDLQVALSQAQANLASAQARYDQTAAGASVDDVASARQSVDNAQRSLDQAQRTAQLDLASAQQALTKLRTGYDASKQNFTSLSSGVKSDLEAYRAAIDPLRTSAQSLLDALAGGTGISQARDATNSALLALSNAQGYGGNTLTPALSDYAKATNELLSAIAVFDAALAAGRDTGPAVAPYQAAQAAYTTAAARLTSAIDAPNGQLAGAQTNVTTAQGSLNSSSAMTQPGLDNARSIAATLLTSLTNTQQQASAVKSKITQAGSALSPIADAVGGSLVSAQQSLSSTQERTAGSVASAESQLTSAQLSFTKTTAGPKEADVASAYASLLSARSAVDKATNDLAAGTLTATTGGVVAAITAQPGENVGTTGNTAFMTIADTTRIALHGTVGEADVAKLKLGQVGNVTVDAVGIGTRMTGKVTLIDPVATIQQGVPVYGVDVTLDVPDAQVRAGMSGTANVILASRSNVLTIPNLAIRTQAGRRYVQVLKGAEIVDTDVQFGLSNDTVTEVVSGLDEGDVVVLPQPRTGTTTPQPGGVRIGGGPVQQFR